MCTVGWRTYPNCAFLSEFFDVVYDEKRARKNIVYTGLAFYNKSNLVITVRKYTRLDSTTKIRSKFTGRWMVVRVEKSQKQLKAIYFTVICYSEPFWLLIMKKKTYFCRLGSSLRLNSRWRKRISFFLHIYTIQNHGIVAKLKLNWNTRTITFVSKCWESLKKWTFLFAMWRIYVERIKDKKTAPTNDFYWSKTMLHTI